MAPGLSGEAGVDFETFDEEAASAAESRGAGSWTDDESPADTTDSFKRVNGSGNHGERAHVHHVDYINAGQEDQMEIHGYRRSLMGTAVCWLMIVATAGILRVVFHWFPEFYLKCTHSACSLKAAERVLIVEMFQKKHRRVYLRHVTTKTAADCFGEGEEREEEEREQRPAGGGGGGGGGDQGEHVLHELNRATAKGSTKMLCLPNADGSFRDVASVRSFTCKKLTYIWNTSSAHFDKIRSWGVGMPTSALHQQKDSGGLSLTEQTRRRAVYGSNSIRVPVKSFVELLMLEVLNPFYIFQVVSVVIWFLIEYFWFAGAIIIMSASGVIISIIQTRQNQRKLRNTVHGSDIIDVFRSDGSIDTVATDDLVPGDVVIIPPTGCTMYCDAVLISGTCIVNESMLTGESVPVTKTPLPVRVDVFYHAKEHSRHTLFCGTRVVQTRFYDDEKVTAVVISTGYMTAKGSLVSAIMYPPPVDFRFERDSYRFIAFLASLASVGLVYSIVQKVLNGEFGAKVVFHSLDIITVCVPPALPAAMTAGIILAQKRLELRNIFCISPRAINVSGSLNCICFDKTGTLTEDGLDLWAVVPVIDNGRCLPPLKTPSKLAQAFSAVRPVPSGSSSSKLEPPLLLTGMATCHSLTIIDGVLSGDPLDLKMFESTGWNLVEPSNDDTSKYDNICPTVVCWKPDKEQDSATVEVGIIKQFPFSSALQRMAVLCKQMGGEQVDFFCKGSPEMVQSLSKPETVPENFTQVLEEYTRQGYRVIAVAHRIVEIRSIHKLQKIQREDLEQELTFLGLVILENRLKDDTTAIIGQLSEASIRTVMVTGDNLLTAISVARDCGMIGSDDQVVVVSCVEDNSTSWPRDPKPTLNYTLAERSSAEKKTDGRLEDIALDMNTGNGVRSHLAVTGKCWSVIRDHYPELVARCVVKGTVFARMSPDQKQHLVQELQTIGYVVGMCGDGANDCGALKAAHTGIALSDSEASVASPFTSRDASIACVPELIRQGRCALVTSFGIFKYMAAYSLTQFISVMILYDIGTNLTDFQFLFIDLLIICSLSALFGHTKPYQGPLCRRPPQLSLIHPSPIGSLLVQVLWVGLFQGFAMILLTQQDWYVEYMKLHNETGLQTGEFASSENYAVFCSSVLQYIVLALAFSKGWPYRKAFFTNYLFVAALVTLTLFSVYAMLVQDGVVSAWLELSTDKVDMPEMRFRIMVLALAAAQVVLCLVTEEVVVDRGINRLVDSQAWLKLRPRKEKYLAIEQDLLARHWPPLNPGTPPPTTTTTSTILPRPPG